MANLNFNATDVDPAVGYDPIPAGKYLAAINDPNQDWVPLEAAYRSDLPKQKLQQLVLASVKISDAELKRQFDAENTKAKVAYVYVPGTKYPVDPANVDDAALRDYYEKHKDDYRTEEQAFVQYVRIDKRPMAADTTAANREKPSPAR